MSEVTATRTTLTLTREQAADLITRLASALYKGDSHSGVTLKVSTNDLYEDDGNGAIVDAYVTGHQLPAGIPAKVEAQAIHTRP